MNTDGDGSQATLGEFAAGDDDRDTTGEPAGGDGGDVDLPGFQ